MRFAQDFVWGASTASYQIERAVYEDGRGWSVWDIFCRKPGAVLSGHNGDVACDHYHRYKKDVALMKEIGLNAYRTTIAWPRILPKGIGTVNANGLDFYIGASLEVMMISWLIGQFLESIGPHTMMRIILGTLLNALCLLIPISRMSCARRHEGGV